MTYDQFAELKVGDPVKVEVFRFEDYRPKKYIEVLPIKAISQTAVALEIDGELRLFHFNQISEI